MRPAPVDFPDLVNTSDLSVIVKVEAWYGGRYLGDVPHEDGTITWDDGSLVVGQLRFSAPRTESWYVPFPDRVRNYLGTVFGDRNPDPLGNDGQRFRVSYGVRRPGGRDVAWVPLGWFRTSSASPDGALVKVTAPDVVDIVQRARFLAPEVINAQFGVGYARVIENMLYPIQPVVFDGLTERVIGQTKTWDRERLDALQELLDAWPAKAKLDESGVLVLSRVDAAPPAGPLISTGHGGNAESIRPERSAESGFNACVAIGTTTDGVQIHSVAYVTSGRRAWDSPYGRNPGFYQSDLLTTVQQCGFTAAAQLQRWLLRDSEVWTVQMRPDPRLEIGDRCPVQPPGTPDGTPPRYGIVRSMTLPMQADAGTMTVTLSMEEL